jgi:hypothetical protein
MIAKDLRNSNKGETLRLPELAGKDKHRRYLIDSVVHSNAGYVRVYTTNARGPWPLTLANDTPVEVTP